MLFRVLPADEPEIYEAIDSSAGLTATFLTLLILSTVIATFGLISNSTATVIGAMIVAPLMGPILGMALGLARGDVRRFRKSLSAELVGVLLCLSTSALIALLLGKEQIDFTQSEIVGRTHPNLLDLAIGFSAGLAGAYATVNRKISSSIAGVAIAVALVPPLCVSGMSLGAGHLRLSLGAFVLFLANFLTIQLAATIVFSLFGLGHWKNLRRDRSLLRAFLFNLLLLLVTGFFLTRQLTALVRERHAQDASREVIRHEFSTISGAHLDSFQARLEDGTLRLDILARAPVEMSVEFANTLQKALEARLHQPVDLRLATSLSSYVTPSGRLFVPEKPAPDDQQRLLDDTRAAVLQALEKFPGAELTNFRQSDVGASGQSLFLAVRSPYVFEADLVGRLQTASLNNLKQRRPEQTTLKLTVRTIVTQDYTAEGLQNTPMEHTVSPLEQHRIDLETQAGSLLQARIDEIRGARLLNLHLVTVEATEPGVEEQLEVALRIRTEKPVPHKDLQAWRNELAQKLAAHVTLQVLTEFGEQTTLSEESR